MASWPVGAACETDVVQAHWFPTDVIRQAVWLYFRVTLILRDVEELLAQRWSEILDDPLLDAEVRTAVRPQSAAPPALADGPVASGRDGGEDQRQPRRQRFTCRLRDFKRDRPPRLLLNHRRSGSKHAACCHIADCETHQIAGPELGVDGAVEHRQVATPAARLQLLADRREVLWLQRRLRADDASCIPGLLKCAK